MLETIMKLVSEQAFGSRPALERPITHLKFGLFGALAAGLIVFLAIAVLATALYMWLVLQGLESPAALVVVSIMLLMSAGLFWGFSARLMRGELDRQELERQRAEATEHTGNVPELLVALLQDTASSFLDGLSDSPNRQQAKHEEAADTGIGPKNNKLV